ncbi:MAG: transposase domain-containing protein [Planctomycetota bacterium]
MGAAIYSLVETCKRCGVEPQAYFSDVLVRVRFHPAERLEELLPRRWKELREEGKLPPLPL